MKKRNKISFLILLVISGLAALTFFYGLFTPYNYLTAKWDTFKNRPRILQYGEAMLSDKEASVVAPKFGFTYDIVAGCLVSTPIINGINSYNAVMTDYLNGELGSNWKSRFDIQVDSLFRVNRVDTIQKIVLAQPDIKRAQHYLDSLSKGKRHLFIWVLPEKKNGANVRVSEIMPDSSIRIFDYFYVDPYSLTLSSVKY